MAIHNKRIIGERTGTQAGPLLIIFAEIHGNEPAGRFAIEELFEAIDAEYSKKPDFDFRGKIVAIRGNIKAVEKNVRYIDKDLNRSWLMSETNRILATQDTDQLDAEDQEIKEILTLINGLIAKEKPTRVVVLDLHTTTAHGGIFTIPAPTEEARRIGLAMHAPVLHGFLDGLQGTSLHYFTQENFGINMTAVCFEAGQHNCDDSPKHAVSAIINCFTAIDGFYPEDIESKHDALLASKADSLPLEANLVYIHSVVPEDAFRMKERPIYQNFDPIEKGELLAHDKNGEVLAPFGGLILMPLYQAQGSDGFFIVQEVAPRDKKNKASLNQTLAQS